MEPKLDYRPPFGLGTKFVDARDREFEIIETHWGLPQQNITSGTRCTIELTNGHRINMHAAPDQSVLRKVTFKQINKQDAKPTTHKVETLQQLISERKIAMR